MHHRGRLRQQVAKHRRRNIRPHPNLLGQDAIRLGAFDQAGKAGLGNAGAAVLGNAAHDIAVAAPHQHVGDGLTQRPARRDRLQVGLTLVHRDVDEIGFGQPRRELQYRSGDGDIVVIGEPAQQFDGSVADRRKMMRELGARLCLDLVDEQPEHVIKQLDMRIAVAACAVQKESRDTLERLDALLSRAALNDLFKL